MVLPLMLGFFLALMPDSGQVFVKVGGLFGQGGFCLDACLAKVVLALMPDSGQVFVKVGGLFGQGCFSLDA